jgi:tetratricopeptide (TPR) repeat protein
MAFEAGTRGDLVTELQQVLAACLSAVDDGDHRAARELADRAELLAADVDVLASANAALISGMVDRAAGDDLTAMDTLARAAKLAGRHLAAADGIRLYLQAGLELAVLHRVRGEYSQAERILLDSLVTSVSGWPEPLDLARLYNELGVVFTCLGDFGQAAKSYRTALSILESVLPEETCELAAVYRNMGALAHARGDHQGAEELARRAVALREQALDPCHVDVAADRAALAAVLLELGGLDEAEQLLRLALPVLERAAPGACHPNHATAVGHLAAVAHRRGHHFAADTLYCRALRALERAFGRSHRDLVPVLAGLARLYRTLGAPARAEALDARAQAILDTVNPDHANTGKTYRSRNQGVRGGLACET